MYSSTTLTYDLSSLEGEFIIKSLYKWTNFTYFSNLIQSEYEESFNFGTYFYYSYDKDRDYYFVYLKNTDLTNKQIEKINKMEYFKQCFIHKSYCKKSIYPPEILLAAKKELGNPPNLLELYSDSYERLEYLGDRVLKLVVSFYLFKRYPKQDEGFMTRLQTKIEDKKNFLTFHNEVKKQKSFCLSISLTIHYEVEKQKSFC